MANWSKEPCLSCEVAITAIPDVKSLIEALKKCEKCKRKEVQNEQEDNMSVTQTFDKSAGGSSSIAKYYEKH